MANVSTDDPLNRFGPFAAVFPAGELRVPGHLPLLGLVPSLANWCSAMIVDAEIAALLQKDDQWDRSPGIVTNWMEAAVRELAKRGIDLRIPE